MDFNFEDPDRGLAEDNEGLRFKGLMPVREIRNWPTFSGTET